MKDGYFLVLPPALFDNPAFLAEARAIFPHTELRRSENLPIVPTPRELRNIPE